MAMRELGPTIDLHGGGTDLIFPHHECEIAQSESVTGEPFSRHWMHSAMVGYDGEKMSKSLGNLVFVSDLLKTGPARDPAGPAAPPLPRRLGVVRHRPRRRHRAAARLLAAAERPDGADPRRSRGAVRAALDDDLDAPRALEALDDLASAVLSGGSDTTAPAVLRELGALARRRPRPTAPVAPDMAADTLRARRHW